MQEPSIQKMNTADSSKKEGGAIIIEATISLTVFMFAMFTLLSLIQIAYVQSRMTVALGCATKEVAQYMHVYYVMGIDTATGAGGGGKSSDLFNKVAELLQSVGGELGTVDDELGQFITDSGTALSGDSLGDYAEHFAGSAVVEGLMKNNLVSGSYSSGDDFLRRNRVENLDFIQSSFVEGGSKNIFMRATYDVRVIKLLNIDYVFHMSTWAYTTAWGG